MTNKEIKKIHVFEVDGIIFKTEDEANSYILREGIKENLLNYIEKAKTLSEKELIEKLSHKNIQLTDQILRKITVIRGYEREVKSLKNNLSEKEIKEFKKSILLSSLYSLYPKNIIQEFTSTDGNYHFSNILSIYEIQSLFFLKEKLQITLLNFNGLTLAQVLNLFNIVGKNFKDFNGTKLEIEEKGKYIFYKNSKNQVILKYNKNNERFNFSKKIHVEELVELMNIITKNK